MIMLEYIVKNINSGTLNTYFDIFLAHAQLRPSVQEPNYTLSAKGLLDSRYPVSKCSENPRPYIFCSKLLYPNVKILIGFRPPNNVDANLPDNDSLSEMRDIDDTEDVWKR